MIASVTEELKPSYLKTSHPFWYTIPLRLNAHRARDSSVVRVVVPKYRGLEDLRLPLTTDISLWNAYDSYMDLIRPMEQVPIELEPRMGDLAAIRPVNPVDLWEDGDDNDVYKKINMRNRREKRKAFKKKKIVSSGSLVEFSSNKLDYP